MPQPAGVTFWRKKPVKITAIQWTGTNYDDVAAFVGPGLIKQVAPPRILILVAAGWCAIRDGDWIAREDGALFVCAKEAFAHNYEPEREGGC